MSLQITVTDPFNLNEKERTALINFLQLSGPANSAAIAQSTPPVLTPATPEAIANAAAAISQSVKVPPAHSGPTVGAVVELDKAGLPYDERIHSAGRTKVADGSWRYKKGLAGDFIAAVEAQLRASVSGVPPVPDIPAPPVLTDVVPPIDTTQVGFGADVAIAEKQANIPPPPVPADTQPEMQFGEVMQFVNAKQSDGSLNTAQLTAELAKLKIEPPNILALMKAPQLWQQFIMNVSMLPAGGA